MNREQPFFPIFSLFTTKSTAHFVVRKTGNVWRRIDIIIAMRLYEIHDTVVLDLVFQHTFTFPSWVVHQIEGSFGWGRIVGLQATSFALHKRLFPTRKK